jgi:hypothetical protein
MVWSQSIQTRVVIGAIHDAPNANDPHIVSTWLSSDFHRSLQCRGVQVGHAGRWHADRLCRHPTPPNLIPTRPMHLSWHYPPVGKTSAWLRRGSPAIGRKRPGSWVLSLFARPHLGLCSFAAAGAKSMHFWMRSSAAHRSPALCI